MYNPGAKEFKGSKSATEAEFEGINQMKKEQQQSLAKSSQSRGTVPVTLLTAHLRGNLRTRQDRGLNPQVTISQW